MPAQDIIKLHEYNYRIFHLHSARDRNSVAKEKPHVAQSRYTTILNTVTNNDAFPFRYTHARASFLWSTAWPRSPMALPQVAF